MSEMSLIAEVTGAPPPNSGPADQSREVAFHSGTKSRLSFMRMWTASPGRDPRHFAGRA